MSLGKHKRTKPYELKYIEYSLTSEAYNMNNVSPEKRAGDSYLGVLRYNSVGNI